MDLRLDGSELTSGLPGTSEAKERKGSLGRCRKRGCAEMSETARYRKNWRMTYKGYSDLLIDLQDMFKYNVGEYSAREGYNGSGVVPTYEDKDRDWMMVGGVPWNMFMDSCKRQRIIRRSDE